MKKIIFSLIAVICILSFVSVAAAKAPKVKIKKLGVFIEASNETKGYITFSVNGKSYAHLIANAEGKQAVVINGKKGAMYDSIDTNSWEFSPDGTKFAYVVRDSGHYFVIVNEQKSPAYDDDSNIQPLVWSPDSSKVVYVAKKNGQRVIVFGNEGISNSTGSYQYAFSLDGKKFIYEGVDEDGTAYWFVRGESGDIEEKSKVNVGIGGKSFFFHPREKKFVFPNYDYDYSILTYRGIQFGPYPPGTPQIRIITPDGEKAVVQVFYADRPQILVFDGQIKEYKYVGIIAFSPDNKQMAVSAPKVGAEGAGEVVVVGNKESPLYNGKIENIIFSPNGKKIAFIVSEIYGSPQESYVVTADISGASFKEISKSKMYFYIRSWLYGSIDITVFPHSTPAPFFFTSNSKKAVFHANTDNGENFIVVGNKKGKAFDYVWGPILAKNGTTINYGAVRGNDILWVTQKVK